MLRIALTDNAKIVDSTYEQVVSIPKLSTGAPVGGVLRTTRSPHGFCCMRLPLSCFEQSFSQRPTHVRAVRSCLRGAPWRGSNALVPTLHLHLQMRA